jgi:hypothetical protein
MKRYDRQPEPAMFGARPSRYMYVAIYGGLAARSAAESREQSTQDAYSLFYARSAGMAWLTRATEESRSALRGEIPSGLWGMNDAEANLNSGGDFVRVAFFQVVLTSENAGDLLPVQPFLACVSDVLARMGSLRLDAVQILLPERDRVYATEPSEELMEAINWFGDCDPELRVPIRITLDGGLDPSIQTTAHILEEWIQRIDQDIFSCDKISLDNEDHLILLPTTFEAEPSSPHHRITLRGTLAEWSLNALGWLAAFLADASSRNGIGAQLMLTADRSAST